MNQTCYYLAYGSNLHPLRLRERIPSCQFIEIVKMPNYSIQFHKHSLTDHSGKCNMLHTNNPDEFSLAAIYSMDDQHKTLLDEFEGEGYEITTKELMVAGEAQEVFWYQAIEDYIDEDLQPYCWYKQLILIGAEFHNFPDDYIKMIDRFKVIEDPHSERHQQHYQLINRMKRYRHE